MIKLYPYALNIPYKLFKQEEIYISIKTAFTTLSALFWLIFSLIELLNLILILPEICDTSGTILQILTSEEKKLTGMICLHHSFKKYMQRVSVILVDTNHTMSLN